MSEETIPENYPRCRLCGGPMGDGGLEDDKRRSNPAYGPLMVCEGCHDLIDALINDALPFLLGQIMGRSDEPKFEKLSIFDYKNWEKYLKKKP